jgi:hypothetical protein
MGRQGNQKNHKVQTFMYIEGSHSKWSKPAVLLFLKAGLIVPGFLPTVRQGLHTMRAYY